MRNIFIFLFILIGIEATYAQTTEKVYIILTSSSTDKEEVIYRSSKLGNLDRTPSIYFDVLSRIKKFSIPFLHLDYDPVKLAKVRPVYPNDNMEIVMKPKSFLDTIHPVDIDTLFPTLTKEKAKELGLSWKGKKVYIIDRNEITPDSVKLIETKCVFSLGY